MHAVVYVRQDGIWSPTAYTIFINSLLNSIQHKQLGVYIGTNYCGIPTVADDVTLISHDPMELQIMLNVKQNMTKYRPDVRLVIPE
jgi:hypothetical protein